MTVLGQADWNACVCIHACNQLSLLPVFVCGISPVDVACVSFSTLNYVHASMRINFELLCLCVRLFLGRRLCTCASCVYACMRLLLVSAFVCGVSPVNVDVLYNFLSDIKLRASVFLYLCHCLAYAYDCSWVNGHACVCRMHIPA